jgi:peptidoglycan biosynthesis protein MviN/MurJ (putative lipid II flippase)
MAPFGGEFLAVIVAAYILRWLLHGYMNSWKWFKLALNTVVSIFIVAVLLSLVIVYGETWGNGLIWMHKLPQLLWTAAAVVWAWMQRLFRCAC